jgi:hypothetical protein
VQKVVTVIFVLFFHLSFAKASFSSYGLLMLHSFDSGLVLVVFCVLCLLLVRCFLGVL